MRPPLPLLRLSTRPLLHIHAHPKPLSTTARPTHPTASPNRRYFTYATLLLSGLSTGLLLSLYLPRPQLLQLIYPLPTPPPHAADSVEAREHAEGLERELQGLELGASSPAGSSLEQAAQREREQISRYTEHRPYATTPPGPHSLTGYSLRGPSRFAIPPLVFASRDRKEQIFFLHLGTGLCGHEGVVHGGLLGTVLDESLGRTALLALPTNIGVTATLSLAYKKPTFANQFVVIKTQLVEVKGRKAWVEGRIESLEGEVLVEAKALFVEPRMAKFLDNSSVKAALA
ncbi:HotDog domain-containing protein [Leucosporidium creatinivorum]|uniref:HotDog domain-containing protein n=1 Tax=Leucosporidium creatinivorum TaxID=106004 RepID=A0A1Y2CK11_9BASI|nr:HotDog domain-containing protein [Leucosporidium creatinivorum]